jgi:hypothetical protein
MTRWKLNETRLLVIKAALKPLLELYFRTPPNLENVSLDTMTITLFDGAAPPDLPIDVCNSFVPDLFYFLFN